ncbi:hypothetical protein [Microbacterium suaedae]|uniref:hypothetical protein n=1 Tax=Microbacterium suaedae TaxID=2067813 RepID=UPI000DAE8CDF|nr:hypothetical protein [Microbacterium suaedae]
MRERRRSWLVGGIGLIACGVIGVVRDSVLGSAGTHAALTLIADVLWAGAILILAVGLSREGSVVARNPLGLAASIAVALWPVTRTLVAVLAGPDTPEQLVAWRFWEYLSMALPLMIGFVAAMQVARARVVQSPWNWAPLWVLGGQTLLWVTPEVIGVASPSSFMRMGGLVAAFGTLAFLASTLGLGILAVVLASRSRAGTVPIYRSSTLK